MRFTGEAAPRAVRRSAHEDFPGWHRRVRAEAADHVRDFVVRRAAEHLTRETEVIGRVLTDFVGRGKYLRSTFVLAGWLCGAAETPAALRAAASAELLHCFALIQDDVMDESATRRGRPAAHVRFADWHRRCGLAGSAERFGESAAVLAADLCLVWAAQMLRESGLPADAVTRALPRYDWLRAELAVGQFRDLVNQVAEEPSLGEVLAVARAKSGHYTVRRPLELGAELAGCDQEVIGALGEYGDAIGEAFQLRDDLLGVFGDPATTGKPLGDDLRAGKATSVVVVARDLATPAQRRELDGLRGGASADEAELRRWVRLIEGTGARAEVERLIDERLHRGVAALAPAPIPAVARDHLTGLALACGERGR
ncbi:polyprenyl synthetase family protein [Actinokineospora sp. PR83]|uniref:polyprenyl synthetase family protein n=1 Tax=Actinokineospora sp. PR83 TaxID=2884908 RepID=UPI0027E11982|nr:polyprenyl synthetase family protein [Actinokineospora sp. PR83]MCG8916399.1 polyprenyl synthetase family protein [Actinokineospora sp. PR83]